MAEDRLEVSLIDRTNALVERVDRNVLTVAAGFGLLVAVAFVSRTLIANYTTDLTAPWGTFWDFRDASYYSVRAALDGNIPWDVHHYLATYPVAQEFPLLPPSYLLVHLPFQLLSLGAASLTMLAINLIGITLLVRWSLRLGRFQATAVQVITVSALAIVSTGGRNLLHSGQTTLLFVAGTYLAITASDLGWGGRIGVIVSYLKPAFGIPVAALLAAAGKWRRALVGTILSLGIWVVLMIPFVIRAGGIGAMTTMLLHNGKYSAQTVGFSLATTSGRVDASAAIARTFDIVPSIELEYFIIFGLIGIAAYVVFRSRRALGSPHAGDILVVVTCITTVTTIYHSVYDLMILVLPMILLVRQDFAGGTVKRGYRLAILGALAVACFNPFKLNFIVTRFDESSRAIELLGPGVTGMALIVALVMSLVVADGLRRHPDAIGPVPTTSQSKPQKVEATK